MNKFNCLKNANLLSPKHSTSKVWRFFGFQHNDGVITDHNHVSSFGHCNFNPLCYAALLSPASQVVCAITKCLTTLKYMYCKNTTNHASHLKLQHFSVYHASGPPLRPLNMSGRKIIINKPLMISSRITMAKLHVQLMKFGLLEWFIHHKNQLLVIWKLQGGGMHKHCCRSFKIMFSQVQQSGLMSGQHKTKLHHCQCQ